MVRTQPSCCPPPTTHVRYYWSLKDYLPPALQEPLALFLTEFVYLPWREAQKASAAAREAAGGPEAAGGGTQVLADPARAEEVQVGGR